MCFSGYPVLRVKYREVQSVGFCPICRLLALGALTMRVLDRQFSLRYLLITHTMKLLASGAMPKL